MSKKNKNNGIPIGAMPMDMETFIAGVDASLANGEYDAELAEETELEPQLEIEKREETVSDALMDVFFSAAEAWEKKSTTTGTPSKFYLTIKPKPQPEGDYAVIMSMKLYYSTMGRGIIVCEKFYGCKTLKDIHGDDWKVALIREVMVELFGITSLFIQAKDKVSASDVIKYQVREGEKKRKNK